MGNKTIQVILKRKSVRSFTDEKIDNGTIDLILKAGMAAPSAMDCRPWRFIVIDDSALLLDIGNNIENSPYTKEASCAIIVLGDVKVQYGGEDALFWVIDCSAATQNILLAVESLGLGAVWTAIYPDETKVSYLRTLLNIPNNLIPLNVIPFGVPGKNPEPKNKYKKDLIFRNTLFSADE
jgi:nitroreductase